MINFSDKLQKLRKDNGLTQEELAEKLFVSRTAVSKWERNAGYPNLDSLKLIAKVFYISLDELLSNDELITIVKEDKKNTISDFIGLSFSIIDLMAVLFIFLPLYGQPNGDYIEAVSLFSLREFSLFLKIPYYVVIGLLMVCGITRMFIYLIKKKTVQFIQILSIVISSLALVLFIVSQEPYAAFLMLLFLTVKVILLFKYNSLEK